MNTSRGSTKDAGWEMGARKTFPVPLGQAWEFLTGPGLELWLGTLDPADLTTVSGSYLTGEGTRGELRSRTENKVLRLTWQPSGAPSDSTVQLRVLPARSGTTISFHHERLTGPAERESMLAHWRKVLDAIGAKLS